MAKGLLLIGLLAISCANADGGWIDNKTLQEFKPKIAASLEWVQTLLKRVESINIPIWSKSNNTNANNKWAAVLTNIGITVPSSIVYKSVFIDPKAGTINILAKVPKVTIKGKYNANGLLDGKPLYGNGNVQIGVSNIDVLARVKLGNIWNKVLVQDVDLTYTIGDIDLSAQGLKLKGTFFVNRHISKLILASARNDIPRLSRAFGEILKVVSNAFIAGSRLVDAVDKALNVFRSF